MSTHFIPLLAKVTTCGKNVEGFVVVRVSKSQDVRAIKHGVQCSDIKKCCY